MFWPEKNTCSQAHMYISRLQCTPAPWDGTPSACNMEPHCPVGNYLGAYGRWLARVQNQIIKKKQPVAAKIQYKFCDVPRSRL